MSFTLHQVPASGSSLHSPMWHVIESSNVIQDDFRYVFIVDFFDGVGYSPITRAKIVADGVLGILDVAPIVRDYLENYFSPGALPDPVSWETSGIKIQYYISYYEEYNVAGVPVSNYLTDGLYDGYNVYAGNLPGANPYTPFSGHSPVLTDRNREISAERGKAIFLPVLSLGGTWGMNVYEYDTDGALLNTFTGLDLSAYTEFLVQLDVSIAAINLGTSNFLPADTALYGFELTSSGTPVTDEYRVRPTCPKATTKHLIFQNQYGGYESMHFTAVNREELNITRKVLHQKEMARPTSVTIGAFDANKVYAGGAVSYATLREQSYKLQSNWLNDNDHEWLKQLVASPEIYLEEGGYYYPVDLKTMKWGAKYTLVDKMYQLELEIETRPVMAQYR